MGYIKQIHKDDDGFIAIGIKNKENWNQYHYKLEELDCTTLNYLLSLNTDTYISINSFYVPVRKSENVRKLNGFLIDLDLHDKVMNEYCLDAAMYFLEQDYFNKIIPEPSIIVNTGRGLQLFFKINNLSKNLVSIWRRVEDSMIEALKDFDYHGFKVDSNCSDVSRVCRLPGTINTKSNSMAKIIVNNNVEYDIDEIIDGYFANLRVIKDKTKKNKLAKERKIYNFYNLHSLHYARLKDIEKLQKLREGNCEGHREFLCFLYRYYSLLLTKDSEAAIEATIAFNSNFTVPLSNNDIITSTKSAEKAFKIRYSDSENPKYKFGGYNYSNLSLIKKLNISSEEQDHLQTIIDKANKYKRKNEKRRLSRRNKNGLTKREQHRVDIIESIAKLKNKGMNNTKIGIELGISRKHVSNLLNYNSVT